MSNKAILENFIVNELLMGKGQNEVTADTSLISSGILDSLSLIRLINFVEEKFNLVIEDDEVIPDNFETINALDAMISAKQT
ncbi:MAG: acyl carrier protein [Candidatus Promineifilaceae bacterium]